MPGVERFAADLRRAGICAAILPDLPLEESGPWCAAADEAGIETIMLAAPTAPDARLPLRRRPVVAASSTRSACSGSRGSGRRSPRPRPTLAGRLKAITDTPVLVGVGVSDAAQAYQASRIADGVIQGASVVRRLMEGGPDAVGEYVAEVRAAIDAP